MTNDELGLEPYKENSAGTIFPSFTVNVEGQWKNGKIKSYIFDEGLTIESGNLIGLGGGTGSSSRYAAIFLLEYVDIPCMVSLSNEYEE